METNIFVAFYIRSSLTVQASNKAKVDILMIQLVSICEYFDQQLIVDRVKHV